MGFLFSWDLLSLPILVARQKDKRPKLAQSGPLLLSQKHPPRLPLGIIPFDYGRK
jgi:hypothetical protein